MCILNNNAAFLIKLVSSTVSKLLGKNQVAVIEPASQHYVSKFKLKKNIPDILFCNSINLYGLMLVVDSRISMNLSSPWPKSCPLMLNGFKIK